MSVFIKYLKIIKKEGIVYFKSLTVLKENNEWWKSGTYKYNIFNKYLDENDNEPYNLWLTQFKKNCK